MKRTNSSACIAATLFVVMCCSGSLDFSEALAAEFHDDSAHEFSVSDLDSGARLYQTYCWFCHGTRGDGNGPVAQYLSPAPRDFVKAGYKLRTTPAGSIPTDRDLYLTITRGVPGTHMPGWHTLNESERWQLVGYLKSLSKRFRVEAAPHEIITSDPVGGTAAVLQEGRDLYNEVKCGLCHGKDGSGEGPISTALVTQWGLPFRARDLRDGAGYKGGSTVEDVFRTISTGFNDTPMVSHHELLSENERWKVAHFVSSLADRKLSREALIEDGISWQRGRWVFVGKGRCIVCHKVEGIGEGTRGPDLSRVGVVAATRQPGKTALQYLHSSITNTAEFLVPEYSAAMPQINQESIFLSADEIRSLVVYLASQGQPAVPDLKDFKALPEPPPSTAGGEAVAKLTGDPLAGWKLFNGDKATCAKCHAIQGRGPRLAPDLTNVASIQSVRQLTESLVEPSKVLTAGFTQVTVLTNDGKQITGVIVKQSASEIHVADEKGKIEVIARDDIDEAVPQKVSNMPANIAKQLSPAEQADLIAFLMDQRPALDDVFYLAQRHRFFDPLERVKNGPPLANVTHKVGEVWLKDWLKNPQNHSKQTFMPNLQLQDDEIQAVMAYLKAVADPDFPRAPWTSEFTKPTDKLSNDEFDKLEAEMSRGKLLWAEARCNLCHRVQEAGGLVGHAPELTNAARKLRQDWLSYWLQDPRYYFAATQMPHFSFSPEERKDLVAYILRSDDFGEVDVPNPPDEPVTSPPASIELIHRGHLIIERSRCHVCHDVPGFEDTPFLKNDWPEPRNDFELLVRDRRCLTCHEINGQGGKFAPELTTMGSRLKKSWIEKFLVAPDVIRPLIQQMPKMKLTPVETRAAADFAKSNLIDSNIDPNFLADFQPTPDAIAAGRELYFAKGCQACHQIGFKGGAVGPALTTIADRLEPGFIYARLKNPQRFKPDVVEPDYGLTNAEATDLTKFMMSLSKAQQNTDPSGSPEKGDQQ